MSMVHLTKCQIIMVDLTKGQIRMVNLTKPYSFNVANLTKPWPFWLDLNIKPPTRKDINGKKTNKSKMKQLDETTDYTQFPKNIDVGALVIARMKPN